MASQMRKNLVFCTIEIESVTNGDTFTGGYFMNEMDKGFGKIIAKQLIKYQSKVWGFRTIAE